MRLFTLLVVCFFVSMASVSYAENGRNDYYNQCREYKKSDAYCTCAVGQPYDDLLSTDSNSNASLVKQLNALQDKYIAAYDAELEQGQITPAQLEMVCDIVDEYYAYLDEIEVDYKKSAGKQGGGRNNVSVLTQEQRTLMSAKRTELTQRIQHLNHDFQVNGARGALSSLQSGTCRMKQEIKWLQQKLTANQQNQADQKPRFDIRQLLTSSAKECAGL